MDKRFDGSPLSRTEPRHAHLFVASLVLLASCGGGSSSSPAPAPAPAPAPPPAGVSVQASQAVGSGGGTVTVTGSSNSLVGSSVVVPANALSANTTISIGQVTSGSPYASDVLLTNLGPSGTTFAMPVTAQIKYSPAYLSDNGISGTPTASTFRVQTTDSTGLVQVLTPSAIDTTNDLVTVQTSHFSNFAPLAYSNSLLNGPVRAVAIGYSAGTQTQPTVNAGAAIPLPLGFQGLVYSGSGSGGTITGTYTGTVDGALVAMPPSFTSTYAVTSSGGLQLGQSAPLQAASTGNVLLNPKLGLGIVTSVAAGANPFLLITGAQGSGFTNASLKGKYAVGFFFFNPNTVQPAMPTGGSMPRLAGIGTAYEIATFDGAGNFSSTNQFLTTTPGGTTSSTVTTGTSSGTYSVAADGTITLTNTTSGASSFQFFALSGGNVALGVSDAGTTSNALESIAIAIKLGTNESAANFTGNSYAHVGYSYGTGVSAAVPATLPAPEPVPLGFFCDYVAFSVDASGNATLTANVQNQDGTITQPGLGTASLGITVNADGTTSITNPKNGHTSIGAVSADGAISFDVTMQAGEAPELSITIQQ